MASRREFLQGTIAVTALPLMTGGALASLAPDSAVLPIHKALYDERFAPARAFGKELRALGIRTQSFKADITQIWYTELNDEWRRNRSTIAGLTAPSALFCLERLAWDHQMRVVFQAEHRISNNRIEHHTGASQALRGTELEAAGERWTGRVAGLVARYPRAATVSVGPTSAGLPHKLNDDATTLYSWIIAPARRSSAIA